MVSSNIVYVSDGRVYIENFPIASVLHFSINTEQKKSTTQIHTERSKVEIFYFCCTIHSISCSFCESLQNEYNEKQVKKIL